MKRGRTTSSDDEAEVGPRSVSNYHLEDDENMPVSFSVLPIQWSDSENSDAYKGKVFLDGLADNGLQKIFIQVIAWRFDLSKVKPEISLLSKDKRWIKLQKPRKSFVDTVKSTLITLHFLHRVKKNGRVSAVSVWKDLSKENEWSSYGFKPSQNDLLDHGDLIGEAAKRDAVLAKSKLLPMVLEKLKSQKLLDKEVKDLEQPGVTGVGIDSDMINEANEESEEDDDLFSSVCALCDNGGKLLCCEGACMRSFHATEDDGKEASCVSLGFTQMEVDETRNFYCKNCEYHQHQCFACGELGSSDKVKGAEVIKCASATCDRFYHPHCVAKLLPCVVKHVAEELARNIADGDPFTCPLHYCCVCKELENKMDDDLRFAVCVRCPKSYHLKCLPREIIFEDEADEDDIPRAWKKLLPNKRVLIYCLNHDIDVELETPVRDHIKFPSMKTTVQEINTAIEGKRPATKERDILKRKNIDLDNSSVKSSAKGSKLTAKLSSDKVGSKKQSNKIISGSNISKKPKSNKTTRRCSTENKRSISQNFEMLKDKHNQPPVVEKLCALKNEGSEQIKPIRKLSTALPPLDADSEKSLLDLFNEARSSITLESIVEKHTFDSSHAHSLRNVVEKAITMGKLEGSVDAVRTALRKLESGCSMQEVEAICDPDVLKLIFKWKIVDKLHWYVQNGDTIVDLCCGANDFSILMKKKLEETGKKCSYRNYDLLPTKNDFSFERRDWMTVQPSELPTGSKLIMGLISPFELKAASAYKFIDKILEFKPKLLILLVPPETERLDKKLPYDLIWEYRNFLSGTVSLSLSLCVCLSVHARKSFILPGSVDVNERQIEQRNVGLPLLFLWSHPDCTTKHKVIAQEHGHVPSQHKVLETESFNADMLAADHTMDGSYADNLMPSHDLLKSTDDQEDQASINEGSLHSSVDQGSQKGQEYRMGKSGKTPCKRKHTEENNRTRTSVVSQAKRQAVNKIPEGVPDRSEPNPINRRSSDEGFQTESIMACPHVEIGDNGYQQLESISDFGRTCSAIKKGPPKEPASSLGSEPRFCSKSGTLGCSVPQPGYGGGLLGFALGPNLAYSRQHSAGWLDE